jgi:hypothetical protein
MVSSASKLNWRLRPLKGLRVLPQTEFTVRSPGITLNGTPTTGPPQTVSVFRGAALREWRAKANSPINCVAAFCK